MIGAPPRRTTVVKRWPFGSPCRGVTMLVVGLRQLAARPFTPIRADGQPTKSRLNRDRFWVAVAEIVATPVSRSVGGS